MELGKHQILVCDNCGYYPTQETLIPLAKVPDLTERLVPGAEVPAGACQGCGALVFIETRIVPITKGERVCPECGGDTFNRETCDQIEGSIDQQGVLNLCKETVLDEGPVVCASCGVIIDTDSLADVVSGG